MDINRMRSNLSMRYLYFSKCSFIHKREIVDAELKMSLSNKTTKIDEHIYEVVLDFIASDGEQFDLQLTANAEFEYTPASEDEDAGLEKKIISSNTIAIMFPFIRSQVSLLTTQPNLQPLIIPPINIKKFNAEQVE